MNLYDRSDRAQCNYYFIKSVYKYAHHNETSSVVQDVSIPRRIFVCVEKKALCSR